MIQFPSDRPDCKAGQKHVGGSQKAGDQAAIKSSRIAFRAAKRKTQSTPTSRVVQEGSKGTPAKTYTVGPAGCLVLAIMVVAIVAAIVQVVAQRGAM